MKTPHPCSIYICLAGFCLSCAGASYLNFTTTSPFVLDFLTNDLTFSCQVSDAKDVGGNVPFLVSLAIARFGNSTNSSSAMEIATVSAYSNATLIDTADPWTVEGLVNNGGQNTSSFLAITSKQPTRNEAGEYVCEASVLEKTGHTKAYSQSLVVTDRTVQPEDVAKSLPEQEMSLLSRNSELEARKKRLEQRVLYLEHVKSQLQNDMLVLNDLSYQTSQGIQFLSTALRYFSKFLDGLNNATVELPTNIGATSGPTMNPNTKTDTAKPVTTKVTVTTRPYHLPTGNEVQRTMPDPKCTRFLGHDMTTRTLLDDSFCNTNMYKTYCRNTCHTDTSKPDLYGYCVDAMLSYLCSHFFVDRNSFVHSGYMTCDHNCGTVEMVYPNEKAVEELLTWSVGGCFPGNSQVLTFSGQTKLMQDLKIGDSVLSVNQQGNFVFSEVYTILHQKRNQAARFHKLTTEHGAAITLTGEHLIYVLEEDYSTPIPSFTQVKLAENVNVGDILSVANFVSAVNISALGSRVVSKTIQTLEGIYTPVTMEGTIVVDNVIASCYVINADVNAAEILFSPVKLFYKFRQLIHSWTTMLQGTPLLSWIPEVGISSYRLDDDGGDGWHWYAKMLMKLTPTIESVRSVIGL